MLVDVIVVLAVEMSAVDVVDVPVMPNACMTAGVSVLVLVVRVSIVCHRKQYITDLASEQERPRLFARSYSGVRSD